MEIIKVENGVKQLVIIANTEEEKEWIKSLGENLSVEIITENASISVRIVTGKQIGRASCRERVLRLV